MLILIWICVLDLYMDFDFDVLECLIWFVFEILIWNLDVELGLDLDLFSEYWDGC